MSQEVRINAWEVGYKPQYTPFIGEVALLILTIDPNFQRNIQWYVSAIAGFLNRPESSFNSSPASRFTKLGNHPAPGVRENRSSREFNNFLTKNNVKWDIKWNSPHRHPGEYLLRWRGCFGYVFRGSKYRTSGGGPGCEGLNQGDIISW